MGSVREAGNDLPDLRIPRHPSQTAACAITYMWVTIAEGGLQR